MEPRRLRGLTWTEAGGVQVPVAWGLRARLLGLALLARERAGPGLLIPRCRSVHTFGMRFAVDLVFLDGDGRAICERRSVPPFRILACRAADAVLETPASVCPAGNRGRLNPTHGGEDMSLIDKLTGRAKKAAGDLTGDRSLRREGGREERKGEAKEERDRAEEAVEDKSAEVSDLDRKT